MSHHKLYANMVLMAEQGQLVSFSSCANFQRISVRSTYEIHKHLPF